MSKLGLLIPGMGAITSTVVVGNYAVRKGLAEPIGLFTYDTIDVNGTNKVVREFANLHKLDDIVFGGWDIEDISMYQRALDVKVLEKDLVESVKEEASSVRTMPGVFDKKYVKKLDGPYVKKGKNKFELAEQVMKDIEDFKKKNNVSECIMIWNGSTEIYMQPTKSHMDIKSFEKAMKENSFDISPSMIYAYAAIKMGIPYANGAPNLTVDIPALVELAEETGTPIIGKDWKTGQTLMKTIVAPGLRVRNIRVDGWFSTNILGNRDGFVLDDPESFKTKEVSKLSVLGSILGYEPFHKVRINYYPPRGDNKEGWDNIDISGFLGYPMQIKIDFLCRDSILAAPLVLDTALLLAKAKQKGLKGIQKWMSFFFKSPQTSSENEMPVHSIFKQYEMLVNKVKELA